MHRSANPVVVAGIALLLVSGCSGPAEEPIVKVAAEAYDFYLEAPSPESFENFLRANRLAAVRNASSHDRRGVEYQVRALEVMAAESVRTSDVGIADDVTGRVAEIEARDLMGVYDETLPGAKDRIAAARARAAAVSR